MIYSIWAPPGGGKTYSATCRVVKHLKRQKKGKEMRDVYTNYPVILKDGTSSLIWSSKLCYENIQDAMIVVDEAYRDVSSRAYRNFTVDLHTFYATNRHNNLDIFLIAQNPARVDVILREMTNQFYYVEPFKLPFMDFPLWFNVYGYLDEKSMSSNDQCWSFDRYLFRREIADAYDTHYFRDNSRDKYCGEFWVDAIQRKER